MTKTTAHISTDMASPAHGKPRTRPKHASVGEQPLRAGAPLARVGHAVERRFKVKDFDASATNDLTTDCIRQQGRPHKSRGTQTRTKIRVSVSPSRPIPMETPSRLSTLFHTYSFYLFYFQLRGGSRNLRKGGQSLLFPSPFPLSPFTLKSIGPLNQLRGFGGAL